VFGKYLSPNGVKVLGAGYLDTAAQIDQGLFNRTQYDLIALGD
jgi:hypothetical protein